MQDLVLFGDLYRLKNPLEENLFCEMLVSKNKEKAHITLMQPICIPNGKAIRIYPKGLSPDKAYRVSELGLERQGDTLMNLGILVQLPLGDFVTKTYRLEQV